MLNFIEISDIINTNAFERWFNIMETVRNLTCKEMRQRGKASLKNKWGIAIGVTIIYVLIVIALSVLPQVMQISKMKSLAVIGITVLLISIISFAVQAALVLGLNNCFIKIVKGEEAGVGTLFSRFNYILKATGLLLLMTIKAFLWSLLFVIPGIVAAYRYSLAMYLMAEDPEMGVVEAIDKSKEIMKGKKGRLFTLQLSFIGWFILGALTCGILNLFYVTPYYQSAIAVFYNIAKNEGKEEQKEVPIKEEEPAK